MKEIPVVFKKFWVQLLYFLTVPSFFLFFALMYDPFRIQEFYNMGRDLMSFNLTMVFCIILLTLVGLRLLFFFLRKVMHLSWFLYIGWCFAELLLISFFVSLYIFLMSHMASTFFNTWGTCLSHILSISAYPYIIATLLAIVLDPLAITDRFHRSEDALMRFHDENKRLKLVVASSAVLFIEADENYVNVHYIEGEREKTYMLRTSMKGIEELVIKHGLVRCHRSYYISPNHVKILRREKNGAVFALLDYPGVKHIPVSRRYYDNLSALL